MRRFMHRAAGKAQEINRTLEREKNLLRSVVDGMRVGILVVDQEGVIRYEQIVGEIVNEPDYEAALSAARNLVNG